MNQDIVFSVEELEARFEMEALAGAGTGLMPDWTCECSFRLIS